MTINNNLVKISELLSDTCYHDGTSIGNRLNITRAAVWKVIKKLEGYGVDLESSKGKGYRLTAPLHLLNIKKIKSLLIRPSVQVELLEKTESTNDYLKKLMVGNKSIKVCIAELQTHGKGRLNRQWHSPFGKNIYLSLLYPFQMDISELSGLSLVVALALCHAIESTTALTDSIAIKWPNDLVIKQNKIGGTLIEIQAESHGSCQTIIGIGLNVNMHIANKKQINQPWSSLLKATNTHQERNLLCAAIINNLIDYLERFSKFGLNNFTDEWKTKDSLYAQAIEVMSGQLKFSGIGAGINNQGHLLIKMNDGTIKAFGSGDTTLLK